MGLCNLLRSFHHFRALAMLSSAVIIIRKCLLSISLNMEILSEESFIDNSGVAFLSISHFFCILHPLNLAFLCHHLPSILSLRGEQCQLNIYIYVYLNWLQYNPQFPITPLMAHSKCKFSCTKEE